MSLEEIENLPILDKETAISQLDDADLFETMLNGFEDMSMRNNLSELKAALENCDFPNIRLSSHSLKGASSYIHAERVKTVASMIQLAIDNNKSRDVMKYYPVLIKECILLKRRIRKEACTKDGIPYCDDDSDYEIPIAKHFEIQKKSNGEFEVVKCSDFEFAANDNDSKKSGGHEDVGYDKQGIDIKTDEPPKNACCGCILF